MGDVKRNLKKGIIDMTGTEKLKEVHEAYENCKKVFEPSEEIIEVSLNIENEDEFEFYRTVHNFFMKQKQMELVKKGVY